MSQPVKLSEALVLEARIAGDAVERSIAKQVEFWAQLGRAIEPLLQGDRVYALCRRAKEQSISERLKSVDSPDGRRRLAEYLKGLPYPHYQQHPKSARLLIRINEDGTRTVGRFINRLFTEFRPRRKR